MDLKQFYGEKVNIVSGSNGMFSGIVCDYISPEDNESGKESIVVNTTRGIPVEFEESDIKEIVIL